MPRLLDLFCGAGGAAMGYSRAGFEIVGVDHEAQPNYPFEFIEDDALRFLQWLIETQRLGWQYDAIHASPPCPRYSKALDLRARDRKRHPDLIAPLRVLLEQTGVPWVIENVPGAPLRNPVQICGSSFGMDLRRHRLFESNFPILVPPCSHAWQTPRFPGTPRKDGSRPLAPVVNFMAADPQRHARLSEAMGIDWMTWNELVDAIPPTYTEHIGEYLMREVECRSPVS
jgi:DNA (cytosine-5)-methyltransferase 1